MTQIIEKYQSNHFLFSWRRPRPWLRSHKDRMWRRLCWIFLLFCLFDGRHGWKNHNQLKTAALKWKNKKHMHSGKELEGRWAEKGRLSCDSDAPRVGSSGVPRGVVLKFRRPSKIVPNSTRLWKMWKTRTPQDVPKKSQYNSKTTAGS